MRSPQPALGPSHSGFHPNPGHTIQDAIQAPRPTLDSSFVEAQSYSGLAFHDAIPPQNHILDPRLSNLVNQTTFPVTPTNRRQDTQGLLQEQSRSLTQSVSPSTIHAIDSPHQNPLGINMKPNFQSSPSQLDHTNFQPPYPPYTTYHPTVNGDYIQGTHNSFSILQSPYQSTQYGHPMTLAQQSHYGRPDFNYPNSHYLNPVISPGVPSAAFNAMTSSHNCQCGPGCNCVFCATHPYNAATRQGVQNLHRILEMDNQMDLAPIPTQSGSEDYPMNDIDMGPVMAPLGEDPLASLNAPFQYRALQPSIDEEGSAASGSHTMRNSQYYPVVYSVDPVDNNDTEADESGLYNVCQCCNGSHCQGHNGLPDHGNA